MYTPYAHPSDHVDPRMTTEQRRRLWALAVDSLWFCEGFLMPPNESDTHAWRTARGGLLLTQPRTSLEEHCKKLRDVLEDITMGQNE